MTFDYLRDRQPDGTLARTWLIQRLDKPYESKSGGLLGSLDNPFAFGGGLVNGGLSKEAMGLLRDIFSFDYMGAAEFEFGSVPATLSHIAELAYKGNLVAHTFEFDKSRMEKDWRKEAKQPTGTATFYVLCEKGDEAEIQSRIEGWAEKRYNSDLKETTRLSDVLDPVHDWEPRTAGWLELNNGFMFFTDETMFNKTAELFGVKVDA